MAEETTVLKTLKVGSEMGLHARPAAQVAYIAGHYKSELKLRRTDRHCEADCRSVLAMLMLAACKDTELELLATGIDAAAAADAVEDYFRRNFNEA